MPRSILILIIYDIEGYLFHLFDMPYAALFGLVGFGTILSLSEYDIFYTAKCSV
jgi:hypothetical protein